MSSSSSFVCIGNNSSTALWGAHYNVLLRPKHAYSKALDNAANAILWEMHGKSNQRWNLIPNPHDHTFYSIVSVHDNKVLDVEGSGGDGARVTLYQPNGQHNQQWQFVPRGNGYYSIHARHNGKVLDITGGSKEDKAPAAVWNFGGGDNQLWKIETDVQQGVQGYTPSMSHIQNIMITAKHSGKVLDNAGYAIQYTKHGGANQRWSLVPVHNETQYFTIVSKHDNKVLDVEGAGGDGAKVLLVHPNGQHNQQWQFTPRGNGYYSIHARHNGKALDITGASKDDKANAAVWNFGGGDNQLWTFVADTPNH